MKSQCRQRHRHRHVPGETDADDFTAVVRLGWCLPVRRGVELTPYLEWLYSRVAVDAYDDGGGEGVLAGHVSVMERDALESALGLNAAWQARPGLLPRAGASLRYLNDDRSVAASIAIPGVGTMASGGRSYDANWHELGLGLDWGVGKRSRLSTSLTTTGGRDYPEIWSTGIALHMGI